MADLPEQLRRVAAAMDRDGGFPRSADLMRKARDEILFLQQRVRLLRERIRDNGSDRNGEDGLPAEGEASQSGAEGNRPASTSIHTQETEVGK